MVCMAVPEPVRGPAWAACTLSNAEWSKGSAGLPNQSSTQGWLCLVHWASYGQGTVTSTAGRAPEQKR